MAPHSLVQEYLNRTEHLWGVVTNGFNLRLLRATLRFTRPSYVDFDLREMMSDKNFADFSLFYRLAHSTRLPRNGDKDCWLERYYVDTVEQGGPGSRSPTGRCREGHTGPGPGLLATPC
jgi:hypothetical protein